MHSDTIKLHLIEEVLKTDNQAILVEIENVFKRTGKKHHVKEFSANEFVGRWSKSEAELIEKAIEDGCEQINEDDWKYTLETSGI